MSEKSIPRQQAALVRRAKTSCWNPASSLGPCSGCRFVMSGSGGPYDARDKGPNRKFWLKRSFRNKRLHILGRGSLFSC